MGQSKAAQADVQSRGGRGPNQGWAGRRGAGRGTEVQGQCPGVHELVHGIMMDGSKCKQGLHREDGLSMLAKINDFAEMFWATKEVKTEKKISPYAPNLEIVVPVL